MTIMGRRMRVWITRRRARRRMTRRGRTKWEDAYEDAEKEDNKKVDNKRRWGRRRNIIQFNRPRWTMGKLGKI